MADNAQYVVLAPYVTLKVKDQAGADVLVGYYKGAVVENVDRDSLRHHLDNGLIAKFGEPEQVAAEGPADQRAQEATSRRRDASNESGRPAGNASRDDWAAYAASKGAPDEETCPVDEGGLPRDDLRAKYGN